MIDMKLNREEKELLKSVERGEWKSIGNIEAEKARLQKIATETLRQDEKENIQ